MTSIPQPQPDSPTPVLFCWSGGKDSALALHALRRRADVRVRGLLTTVTEDYDRISMHGVRRALLLQQAEALGLPLHEVRIPPQCVNPVYESCMEQALRAQIAAGVHTVAFGDTRELAREFCQQGFRAIAVCIDPKKLDRSFAGRELTADFFSDLPAGVDPCGENGEFHTFVFAGPILSKAIAVHRGEVVERDGFTFCDLKEQTL